MNALRPVIQKQPRVENRTLLDLAHTAPCFAAFPHKCTAHLGCHPAHNNWQQFGKGVGKKTSDWLVAFVCGAAHKILDGHLGQETLSRDERLHHWINAFIATWDWLWREKKVRVT